MARLVLVRNPFDPIASREVHDLQDVTNLKQGIERVLGSLPNGYDITCSINSQIETDLNKQLTIFDTAVFCLTPKGGGGGGGKNIVATVAMLAVVIAAPQLVLQMGAWATTTVGGVTTMSFAGGLATGGLIMAGGLLVNALLPPKMPSMNFPTWEGWKDSPTYAWDSTGNITQEGAVLPVLYGRHRVKPPVISRFISQSGDNQYLNILYAVAGHEVQSIGSVRINEQSINNFQGVTVETRLGTNNQTAITGFDDVRSTTPVNALVAFGVPVSRETSSNAVNQLNVGIYFPRGLYFANDNGSLSDVTIKLRVRYRLVGGSWQTEDFTITDATNSLKRTFLTVASGLTSGQYEVEVSLLEEPPSGSRYGSEVFLEYIQAVIAGDRFTYPNTALLAIRALATNQLSGQDPIVDCIAERSVFPNGKTANNPAWICEDLITNADYGGSVDTSRIMQTRFQTWADYCTSKNLQCNIYFDTAQSVRGALNTVSTLGWGNVLQAGSKFMPVIEKEEEPIQRFLFTVGNILYNSYVEEYMPQSERANSVEITYYDKTLQYDRQTIELFQHNFDTSETETRKTSVNLIGQTDRDKAIRHGKRLLNFNRYLSLTASWQADVDAIACTIGDVVDVQHDVPQRGFGGRIVDFIDTTTVEIDRSVTFETGKRYHFTCKDSEDNRQTVEVVNSGGTTSTLFLMQPITLDLEKYDLYSFGEINKETKAFRIVNISRQSDQLRKISALEYFPEVYLDSASVPNFQAPTLTAVRDLRLKEVWQRSADGSGISKISANWQGESLFWDIYIKKTNEDYKFYERVYEPRALIFDDFRLFDTITVAVVVGEVQTNSVNQTITLLGEDLRPNNVTGFQAWQQAGRVAFRWNHIPNIESRGYQIRRGLTWDTGQIVVDRVQENQATWNPPASGTYRFMIKAVNNQLQFSEEEAVSIMTADIESVLNFVINRDEIPDYIAGANLFNLIPLGSPLSLKWLPTVTFDELSTYTFESPEIDGLTFSKENGVYESEVFDLGRVADILGVRMDAVYTAILDGSDIRFMDLPSTRTFLDFPNDTFENITSESTYRPYYRFSEEASPLPDYQLWTGVADMRARYFQFKWETQIDIPATRFAFESLLLSIDTKAQEKVLTNETISNTGTTFNLSTIGFSYIIEYAVNVTVLGSNSRYATVVQTDDDFTVYVFNQDGVGVENDVNITIRGF